MHSNHITTIHQNSYDVMTSHEYSWSFMKYHDCSWVFMRFHNPSDVFMWLVSCLGFEINWKKGSQIFCFFATLLSQHLFYQTTVTICLVYQSSSINKVCGVQNIFEGFEVPSSSHVSFISEYFFDIWLMTHMVLYDNELKHVHMAPLRFSLEMIFLSWQVHVCHLYSLAKQTLIFVFELMWTWLT